MKNISILISATSFMFFTLHSLFDFFFGTYFCSFFGLLFPYVYKYVYINIKNDKLFDTIVK
jgi:hypothetical protein